MVFTKKNWQSSFLSSVGDHDNYHLGPEDQADAQKHGAEDQGQEIAHMGEI